MDPDARSAREPGEEIEDEGRADRVLSVLGLAEVPRTEQTTCYKAAGTVIDCAVKGQDGICS